MLGYKALAKLDRKKYRQQYGVYLVEGKKTVLEAAQASVAGSVNVLQLVTTPSFLKENQEYIAQKEIQYFFTSNKVLELGYSAFANICDTSTPQEIAAVVSLPEYSLEAVLRSEVTSKKATKTIQTGDSITAKPKTIAILEDIRDPGNVGTIIRTADWFGLDGLICLGGADPFQPKVVRSSMGSIFRVPIFHVGRSDVADMLDEIIADTKAAGYQVITSQPELATEAVAAEKKSQTKLNANNTQETELQKVCFILGNEARGTSAKIKSLADSAVSIPKFGQAESLNVAISFGILVAQRKLK
jgi:TrmH family RNA methyltransferase